MTRLPFSRAVFLCVFAPLAFAGQTMAQAPVSLSSEDSPLPTDPPSSGIATLDAAIAAANGNTGLSAAPTVSPLQTEIQGIIAPFGLRLDVSQNVVKITEETVLARLKAIEDMGGDPKRLSFRDKETLKAQLASFDQQAETRLSPYLRSQQKKTLSRYIKSVQEMPAPTPEPLFTEPDASPLMLSAPDLPGETPTPSE